MQKLPEHNIYVYTYNNITECVIGTCWTFEINVEKFLFTFSVENLNL
jgi:hypothetical protein